MLDRQLVQSRSRADLVRPAPLAREQHIAATKARIDELIAAKSGEAPPKPAGPETIEYSVGGEKRVLTIVDRSDPLEPPRTRYRKQLDLEPVKVDNRAPILRAPPPKLSAADKAAWHIPPSLSNWKNDRGYLVDLETRAAAQPSAKPRIGSRDTAAALAAAAASRQEQLDAEEQAVDRRRELRTKLRAQREKDKQRSKDPKQRSEKEHPGKEHPGKERSEKESDVFDTRLFHSSKRKHSVYDESLFPKSAKRMEFEK